MRGKILLPNDYFIVAKHAYCRLVVTKPRLDNVLQVVRAE